MTTRTQRSSARWAALGVLLGGLGAAVGPAEAVTLIQICTPPLTIDKPGLYVLARDLNCPGDGIIITADGVRLVLGGRTLTGSGGGSGVRAAGTGANPTLEGLRIEGGTVAVFAFGVVVRDAPGARIAGVTATGNTDDGIAVRTSPGARIAGSTATRNGGDGIDLAGCDGCVLAGNRVVGNGDIGIEVESATGARIAGNTVTGNVDDGIDLQGEEADGNLVRGNTASGNGDNGIVVDAGSTGNRLEGNRATGNVEPDLEEVNLPACVNTWRGNRFVTDNEQGTAAGPGAGCIQ